MDFKIRRKNKAKSFVYCSSPVREGRVFALSLVEDEGSGALVGVGEPVHAVVVPAHQLL
jgi:hypothetical protein